MANYISTWIYLDSEGDESYFPQSCLISSSKEHQIIYWRCVYVFFTFARKFNPNTKLVLFTNYQKADIFVDGIDIFEELKLLNVAISFVEYTYKPPKNYYHSFQNQLYEFDILKNFLTFASSQDNIMILDSDCLILETLDFTFEQLKDKKALTLLDEYKGSSFDCLINGITKKEMNDIFMDLSKSSKIKKGEYLCGEFFCATYSFVHKIFETFDEVYNYNINKFLSTNNQDTVKFNEEAHFFSYFYWLNDIEYGTADKIIKRMWTAENYNTILKDDYKYPIWHLLSGKKKYTEITNILSKLLNLDDSKRRQKLDDIFLHPKDIITLNILFKQFLTKILRKLGLYEKIKSWIKK